MLTYESSNSTHHIVDWTEKRTLSFIDIYYEHITNRKGWVDYRYSNIVVLFNAQMSFDYNHGQMKNKFNNLKHEWNPWNKLLQIDSEFWNVVDTVGVSDEWWDLVATRYRKFKVDSPSKLREMNVIFESCIRTLARKFDIPEASPANTPFDTRIYIDFFIGDVIEISTHTPRSTYLHLSTATFSRKRQPSGAWSPKDEMKETVE